MLEDNDTLYLLNFRKVLAQKYHKSSELDIFNDPTCYKEYQLEFKKVKANIPLKFRNATLTDLTSPQAKEAKAFVQEYTDNLISNKKLGIAPLLVGTNGTGKTLAGCAILIKAVETGYSAYFTKVKDCVDKLTTSWYDDDTKRDFNEQILSVDFLLLDDVGDEFRSLSSNLIESTLNTILRTRADNLRPTIITTNKAVKDMKTVYDSRIYSILKEHALIIPFDGIDYRDKVISPKINIK